MNPYLLAMPTHYYVCCFCTQSVNILSECIVGIERDATDIVNRPRIKSAYPVLEMLLSGVENGAQCKTYTQYHIHQARWY